MVGLHIGGTDTALWRVWDLDPFVLTVLVLWGALYALGLRRAKVHHIKLHPWWRPTLFYFGLSALFVALLSPLDHLAGELFAMHMVQHLLLVFVAPPLILLSAPVVPVLRGFPRPLRRRLVIPVLRNRGVRLGLHLMTLPLVTWALYVSTLIAWHTPGAYEAALRNEAVHVVEHLTFTLAAFLFWWNVIDSVPLRSNLSYIGRVPYVFFTTVPNFTLGAFLTFSDKPWYDFYVAKERQWGLSAIEDQQIGGVLMWVPGSLVLLSTLLLVLVFVVVSEQRRQDEWEMKAAAQRSPP